MSYLEKIAGKLKSFSKKFSPEKDTVRRRILFETLERRLLLSADPVTASQDLQKQKDLIPDPVPALMELDTRFIDAEVNAAENQETGADAGPAPADIQNSQDVPTTTISIQDSNLLSEDSGRQLIFVDPSVPDYESLLGKLGAESSDVDGDSRTSLKNEVIILDSNRDGLEQITETLKERQGISAVHILSHGDEGTLRLGNSIIDRDDLEGYSEGLKTWQDSMAEGGDILLYGCNIADGEIGIAFVEDLSAYTGADVAASTDDTGSASLGGDWNLEYSTGLIESRSVFGGVSLEGYQYVLDEILGTDDADTLIGNEGLNDTIAGGAGDDVYQFQESWGNDAVIEIADKGIDTLDFSAVTTNLTFTINADGTISVTDGTNNLINVANIEKIIGGSGSDTLIGPSGGATSNLTGDNTGMDGGHEYSNIQNQTGSATRADT